MQVILMERVANLGQMGDEVSVKPGYARNYLLPQRKALRASKANRDYFRSIRKDLEARNLERRREAEEAAAKVDGKMVVIVRQAGETGQLYGSVTARDVGDALAEEGAQVARNQINLDRQIKTVGLHPITLTLHPEVTAEITVNVARTTAEAENQAAAGRAVTREEQEAMAERAVADVLSEVESIEVATDSSEEEATSAE